MDDIESFVVWIVWKIPVSFERTEGEKKEFGINHVNWVWKIEKKSKTKNQTQKLNTLIKFENWSIAYNELNWQENREKKKVSQQHTMCS